MIKKLGRQRVKQGSKTFHHLESSLGALREKQRKETLLYKAYPIGRAGE